VCLCEAVWLSQDRASWSKTVLDHQRCLTKGQAEEEDVSDEVLVSGNGPETDLNPYFSGLGLGPTGLGLSAV